MEVGKPGLKHDPKEAQDSHRDLLGLCRQHNAKAQHQPGLTRPALQTRGQHPRRPLGARSLTWREATRTETSSSTLQLQTCRHSSVLCIFSACSVAAELPQPLRAPREVLSPAGQRQPHRSSGFGLSPPLHPTPLRPSFR